MFRMWGKLWKDNHLLRDTVAANGDYSMSRTAMVFQALDEICREFDLGQPIWLDSNIKDFKLHDKTRFTRDSFIEEIDFDYLEIHVIRSSRETASRKAWDRQFPQDLVKKRLTCGLLRLGRAASAA